MKKSITIIFIILLFFSSNSFSEEIRKPAVKGGFYPADKEVLKETIKAFLENVDKIDRKEDILAIVVPHAGYVYSGKVAAYGFKQLEGRDIDTVVIICNSHRNAFTGIAVDESSEWQTPLGLVEVDKDLAGKIVKESNIIQYNSDVHKKDHTIEVELPFLQVVLKKDFKIVPILFGNVGREGYKRLANILYKNLGKNDVLIISTDLSHYPSYKDANKIDKKTLELIKESSISALEVYIKEVKSQNVLGEDTLSCGIDGIKTAMELYNIYGGKKIEILKYANSGDIDIGDKSRVVGYGSMIMYIPRGLKEKREDVMNEEYLNKKEKNTLMEIAKSSIIEAVTGKKAPETKVTEGVLTENSGAFVTIKKHQQLRGCIGYIIAAKPLYETVKEVAKSAALNDPRFTALSEEELKDIDLEISVLTPLKRSHNVEEIVVGKHGLYMRRGFNSGILLPQVPTEYGWDRETFLEHTCMKAGLPKDAWKDKSTEIYTFTAEVFSEKDLK